MPYIKPNERSFVNNTIDKLAEQIETEGDLNYVFSRLVHRCIELPVNGKPVPKNYQTFNAVMGAMECAKLEFYRTVVAPYEDKKKAENGSVSSLDA